MKLREKFGNLILTCCFAITVLAGCSDSDDDSSNKENKDGELVSQNITLTRFNSDDTNSDWSNGDKITLNGNEISTKSSDVTVDGTTATITKAGTYILSGNLTDGQIVVNLSEKGNVQLVLNGVDINNSKSSPIYIANAKKTIITLADGTDNKVSDTDNYTFAEGEDEPDATIFSKDDVTFNGSGQLTVNANYGDGIASKDELKFCGGVYNIFSSDDAIRGKDLVAISCGTFNLKSKGDGIKATNDADISLGYIYITGGTFNTTSSCDGIQAETSVIIDDGEFNIITGGGSANVPAHSGENNMGGDFGQRPNQPGVQPTTTDTSISAKGIKGVNGISIKNGKFTIDSSDDAIHSNNVASISGGEFEISSGDDGIHANKSLTISDGKINIIKSYEGLEATAINIQGGTIDIVASDDGVNAANSVSTVNDMQADSSVSINISGGKLSLNAGGDGVDSNGNVTMIGGEVYVNGPTNSGNGALDYNGTFDISGGVLIASGSSGMAQAPSTSSNQNSIHMTFTSSQSVNQTIKIVDSSGNTVISFIPSKSFQTIVFSSLKIEKDKNYSIYKGDAKVNSFEVSDSVTYLNESGVTTGGNMGGMPGGNGGEGVQGGGGKHPGGKPQW